MENSSKIRLYVFWVFIFSEKFIVFCNACWEIHCPCVETRTLGSKGHRRSLLKFLSLLFLAKWKKLTQSWDILQVHPEWQKTHQCTHQCRSVVASFSTTDLPKMANKNLFRHFITIGSDAASFLWITESWWVYLQEWWLWWNASVLEILRSWLQWE